MLSRSRMARSSCDGVSDAIDDVTDGAQASVVSLGCTLPLFRLSSHDMAGGFRSDGSRRLAARISARWSRRLLKISVVDITVIGFIIISIVVVIVL